MEANRISNFLGETSNKFHHDLFTVSIVDYHERVSEDWHYHENIHLSSILVGGNRESRKDDEIIVEPGRVMTYREGEIHRNRNTVHPSKNLNIELSTDFFNDEFNFSNFELSHTSYLSILKIYHELQINDIYTSHSIPQLIESFFFKNDATKVPDWIETLKILLNDRWREFIPLEDISSELGLHPVSISKGFAKHSGYTIADWMRIIKVKQAVFMVLNSSLSLTEIAYKCGLSDQSHMNRLFRHYIGFSPKKLRRIRLN